MKFKNEEKTEKSSQLLLEGENKKYFDLLGQISPENELEKERKEAAMLQKNEEDTSKLEVKFKNTKIFTKEEIHKECARYDLDLIKARSYTGKLSLETLKKVHDFCSSYIVSEYDYKDYVYLLVSGMDEEQRKEKSHYPERLRTGSSFEPLVFVRTNLNEDNYILIDGEPTYRSVFRYLLGYFTNNKFTKGLGIGLIIYTLSVFISCLFGNKQWLPTIAGVVAGVIALIIATLSSACSENTYYSTEKIYGITHKARWGSLISLLYVFFIGMFFTNVNLWIHGETTYYEKDTTSLKLNEARELIKDFNPDRNYEKVETYYKTYSPGIIFPSVSKVPAITEYKSN